MLWLQDAFILIVGFSLVAVFILKLRLLRVLRADEQLRVQSSTGMSVRNGPGFKFVSPFETVTLMKAETIGILDYIKIRDTMHGSERVAVGPNLLFLGPYEQVTHRGHGVTLSSIQYVVITNAQTGEKRVQKGPCTWIPGAGEEGEVGIGVSVSSTEYLLVEDKETGERKVERGPRMWIPGPTESATKGCGVALSSAEYVVASDKLTGAARVDRGPCMWFPGPHEEWTKGTSISLSNTRYLTVLNRSTGETTIVKGPCVWYPQPYDEPSEVKTAMVLQEDEFVKLKDQATGRRWVQSGKSLVFLEPTWEIESNDIQKAWALRGREWLRLQVAPRFRISRSVTKSSELKAGPHASGGSGARATSRGAQYQEKAVADAAVRQRRPLSVS